jgi:hypothetical protein
MELRKHEVRGPEGGGGFQEFKNAKGGGAQMSGGQEVALKSPVGPKQSPGGGPGGQVPENWSILTSKTCMVLR